jgi:hypothetical protein
MTTLLATDSVAVGVTVIATLVIVALAGAVWYLLKTVRELRQEADGLARQAEELLDEMDLTLHQAGLEVDRVDRMVGSAEAISDAVGSASRLVGGAVTAPFIKVVAFGTGVARGLRLVRGRPRPEVGTGPKDGRRWRKPVAEGGRLRGRRGLPRSKAIPVRSSAVKASPVKSSPVKASPVKASPVKSGSVKASAVTSSEGRRR